MPDGDAMPRNLTTTILAEHLVSGRLESTDEIALPVDQVQRQDATDTMSCLQYLELFR
jgi:hypothetical protein